MTARQIFTRFALGLAVPLIVYGQGPIDPRPSRTPQQPAESARATLHVDSTLVLVPVEVSDPMNRPVSGLQKEDFRVYDDKVEQTITSFSKENDPIAICLVFDVSSSMTTGTKDLREQRIAAQYFFRSSEPGDEYCVVVLASSAKVAIPLTGNASKADNEIMFAKPGGTTALLDGVYLGLNELKKSKKLRKALIVISDGGENNSRYTPGEVLQALRESEVLVYAVGNFGGNNTDSSYPDRVLLRGLTRESGGRMFPPTGIGTIYDFADKVIIDLRNRYVLGFSPTNAAKDGSYHHLEVKIVPPKGLPKLSAHWKTGYYAATQ